MSNIGYDNGTSTVNDDFLSIGTTLAKFGFKNTAESTKSLIQFENCPDCAVYCGWYSQKAYMNETFRFNRGAIAMHLYSGAATSVRDPADAWVAQILRSGAAATCGTVYEPLTTGFPQGGSVFTYLTQGYTWGEAGNMANLKISWQACFVGDPLYRPFATNWQKTVEKNIAMVSSDYSAGKHAFEAGDYSAAYAILEPMTRLAQIKKKPDGLASMVDQIRARAAESLAAAKNVMTGNDVKTACAGFLKVAQSFAGMSAAADALVAILDLESDPKTAQFVADARRDFDAGVELGKALQLPPKKKAECVKMLKAIVKDYAGTSSAQAAQEKLTELQSADKSISGSTAAKTGAARPDAAQELFDKGVQLLKEGKEKDARAYFERVVKEYPNSPCAELARQYL